MQPVIEKFVKEARQKKIKFYILFDHEVGGIHKSLSDVLGRQYKFIPAAYSTPSLIDVFGDHVVISSKAQLATFEEDITLTVIINEQIAKAFRTWFQFMWDLCPAP